jgi:hypothetical protein
VRHHVQGKAIALSNLSTLIEYTTTLPHSMLVDCRTPSIFVRGGSQRQIKSAKQSLRQLLFSGVHAKGGAIEADGGE